MPGVKGRSGGSNKKSAIEHMSNGTYRQDRHGAKNLIETTAGEIVFLPFTDDEKPFFEILKKTIPKIPDHMGLPFSIFVHNLSEYSKAHAQLQINGNIETGEKSIYLSPYFKARNESLKNLRADFSTFAMSISDQVALLDIATKTANRMAKPKIGKPLE